ncbi:MAG: hypothetical protein U1F26_00695 [Lysobacterales bacterium]
MSTPATARRLRVLRELGRFQLKLMLDALRDLVMSPWSMAAAALDVLKAGRQEPEHFAAVIRAGRKTEEWIDLWGENAEGSGDAQRVDQLIERLESALRAARDRPEQLQMLRSWLQQRVGQRPGEPPPPPAAGSP